MSKVKKGVGYFILFAPFIFICHFSEEASGFVLWFNQHVHKGINYRLFWDVNITAPKWRATILENYLDGKYYSMNFIRTYLQWKYYSMNFISGFSPNRTFDFFGTRSG